MQQISLIVGALALCGLLSNDLMAQSVGGATASSGVVSQHDNDGDETLDLAEVNAAAGAHFDKLDKDSDGTLDRMEGKRVMDATTFDAADADNDGTLSKDEYLALVDRLFTESDVDHDGSLSVKELTSKSAHQLKLLID